MTATADELLAGLTGVDLDRGQQVVALYQRYLGRLPDPGGWNTYFISRMPVATVEVCLATSPEAADWAQRTTLPREVRGLPPFDGVLQLGVPFQSASGVAVEDIYTIAAELGIVLLPEAAAEYLRRDLGLAEIRALLVRKKA